MNLKRIAFSGLITAGVGAIVAVAIAQIAPPPYQSKRYQQLVRFYPMYGALAGLVSGACVDTVLQLKREYERKGEE